MLPLEKIEIRILAYLCFETILHDSNEDDRNTLFKTERIAPFLLEMIEKELSSETILYTAKLLLRIIVWIVRAGVPLSEELAHGVNKRAFLIENATKSNKLEDD